MLKKQTAKYLWPPYPLSLGVGTARADRRTGRHCLSHCPAHRKPSSASSSEQRGNLISQSWNPPPTNSFCLQSNQELFKRIQNKRHSKIFQFVHFFYKKKKKSKSPTVDFLVWCLHVNDWIYIKGLHHFENRTNVWHF